MKILNFAKTTVAVFILANFATIALGDKANIKATSNVCDKISVSWTPITDQTELLSKKGDFGDYAHEAYITSDSSYTQSITPSNQAVQYCYKIQTDTKTCTETAKDGTCTKWATIIAYSDDYSCTTPPAAGPVTPAKPIISVNHGQDALSILLTWVINPNGNIPNECVQQSGFELWRQSPDNPLSVYKYSTTNSYYDTGIKDSIQYTYQVRAYLNTYSNWVYSPGFSPSLQFSVTSTALTTSVSGSGSVSGLGINCGTDCKEVFATGTPVTLTATPALGYKFSKWQGGSCNSSGNPCSFTINSTTNITAIFVPDTTPPTVSLTSPTLGQTRMDAINFAAQASDDVGVTKVEFYANTTLLGTVTSAPYQLRVNWNPQSLPYGTYDFSSKAYDAAGNVGVSAPVKAKVISGQLILNSSFEPQVTEWTATNGVLTNGPTSMAHTGSGYASLHLANIAGSTDSVYQPVTLPADAVTANLSYWLRVDSSAPNGTVSYDKLTATVRDTAGNILGTLGTYSSINRTANYTENRFDLSAYKGMTIGLYFQSTKPGSPLMLPVDDDVILSSPLDKSLRFYIDDVTLNVTQ